MLCIEYHYRYHWLCLFNIDHDTHLQSRCMSSLKIKSLTKVAYLITANSRSVRLSEQHILPTWTISFPLLCTAGARGRLCPDGTIYWTGGLLIERILTMSTWPAERILWAIISIGLPTVFLWAEIYQGEPFSWCLGSLCVGRTWSEPRVGTGTHDRSQVSVTDKCAFHIVRPVHAWALGIPQFLYFVRRTSRQAFTCSRISQDVGWRRNFTGLNFMYWWAKITDPCIDLGGMINYFACFLVYGHFLYGMLNSELCFIKFVVIKGRYIYGKFSTALDSLILISFVILHIILSLSLAKSIGFFFGVSICKANMFNILLAMVCNY